MMTVKWDGERKERKEMKIGKEKRRNRLRRKMGMGEREKNVIGKTNGKIWSKKKIEMKWSKSRKEIITKYRKINEAIWEEKTRIRWERREGEEGVF